MNVPAHIAAAYLTQPHGLKGHLKAKVLLENPELLQSGPLATSREGLTLTVTQIKLQPGGMALLTLAECGDRTAAESLKGLTLLIPRDILPPTAEDEIYLHDLLQKPVVSPTGAPMGMVTELRSTPTQDYLELKRPDGKTTLIPAHADYFEDLAATPLVLTDLGLQVAEL